MMISQERAVQSSVQQESVLNSSPVMHRAALSLPLILFLGGMNLILIQWVLVREMTALLLGTELVVLLVTAAYFAGLSIGYSASGHIRREWLIPAGVITLVLHLTLPVWFRLVTAALGSAGLYALAFLVLPIMAAVCVPAFYSVFLPLFADSGAGKLARLYSLELLGSAVGIGLLVLLGGVGPTLIYGVYGAALVMILVVLGIRWWSAGLLIVSVIVWLIVLPQAHGWSNAVWYTSLLGLDEGTITLYSAYSPYQKIDVMMEPDGTRHLYLDGLSHFGSDDESRLNVMMGAVPAAMLQPEQALVIGAGSMEMERMIARYAGHVTTVEIDPLVVYASETYFDDVNLMSVLENRTVIVDDAKHFAANTAERYSMISMDVPAAFTIQTATLYTQPFYEILKTRLNPGGVLVANLTVDFTPESITGRRIAASLLATFNDVMVVTPASAGWSFAYAGDDLPFSRRELERMLRESGESQYAIFDTEAVRSVVSDAAPITLDSMALVLQTSADWLKDRLQWR